MHPRMSIIIVSAIVCGVLIALFVTQAKTTQGNSIFAAGRNDVEVSTTQVADGTVGWLNPRLSVDSTDEEVAQEAIRYTEERFPNEGDKVKVAYLQRIKLEELTGLGLPQTYDCVIDPPPYVLVVLKGNFDIKNMRGMDKSKTLRVKYVGYVYDLRAGAPRMEMTDPDGSRFFRRLLKDPSIPEPKKPEQSLTPTGIPGQASPPCTGELRKYGEPAVGPTVVIPPTNTPLPFEPPVAGPAYPAPAK